MASGRRLHYPVCCIGADGMSDNDKAAALAALEPFARAAAAVDAQHEKHSDAGDDADLDFVTDLKCGDLRRARIAFARMSAAEDETLAQEIARLSQRLLALAPAAGLYIGIKIETAKTGKTGADAGSAA